MQLAISGVKLSYAGLSGRKAVMDSAVQVREAYMRTAAESNPTWTLLARM